jgi:hypothetical protein
MAIAPVPLPIATPHPAGLPLPLPALRGPASGHPVRGKSRGHLSFALRQMLFRRNERSARAIQFGLVSN